MVNSISYAPLLDWQLLAIAGVVLFVLLVLAAWLGLRGWFMRGLAGGLVLAALANPSYKQEDRTPLTDIVFLLIDETASQDLSDRRAQMEQALPELRENLQRFEDIEVVEVTIQDAPDDAEERGTLLLRALAKAAAEVSQDRIAGAVIVSDGQVHDLQTPDFPAPVHLVQTGDPADWDRRIILENAPAFGIVGESIALTLRVEDSGPAPRGDAHVTVLASVDGQEEQSFQIPLGETVTLDMELEHAGINLLDIRTPNKDGEITDRNNRAILTINGVRDRLRVLLVSGEPYAGERTWRNLLKADASVDLVHFTILRSPEKQDGVPVSELSLIAFPTRELFIEKIEDFDLIIFDRYRLRGILPALYLENVANYVRRGGAILIATGPAFAEVESIARSSLRTVLPALPTGRILEEGYTPLVSELGLRHPVTAGLSASEVPEWGRWFRQIDMQPRTGHVIMEGVGGRPLLLLDRVENGRIALLGSDHAWLWSRGFEGGGPQLELLRRLAHWLMQEPELEEEVLQATASENHVTVERRSLGGMASELTFTDPSGVVGTAALTEISAGKWQAEFEATENGVYRITDGELQTVVAIGPAAPREFERPIGVSENLSAMVKASGGGSFALATRGTPDIRRTRVGRVAKGANWLGLPRREAYTVQAIRLTPLAPGWLILLLVALLSLAAWRFEGR